MESKFNCQPCHQNCAIRCTASDVTMALLSDIVTSLAASVGAATKSLIIQLTNAVQTRDSPL